MSSGHSHPSSTGGADRSVGSGSTYQSGHVSDETAHQVHHLQQQQQHQQYHPQHPHQSPYHSSPSSHMLAAHQHSGQQLSPYALPPTSPSVSATQYNQYGGGGGNSAAGSTMMGMYDPSYQQHSMQLSTSSASSSASSSSLGRHPSVSSMSAAVPVGLPGPSSTSSSGAISVPTTRTPSSTSSSGKAPRARVNMACVHCRSRKIRCDGQRPNCSTCNRLGRSCHYENISEEENVAVRERKKKSRDAKQARLDALAQLGVPMPRAGSAAANFLDQRRRSFGTTQANAAGVLHSVPPGGMASPSVLRESRSTPMMMQQQQQERQQMYGGGANRHALAPPPPLPSPHFNTGTSEQQRVWQGQAPPSSPYGATSAAQYSSFSHPSHQHHSFTGQQLSMSPMSADVASSEDENAWNVQARRRGVTISGYEQRVDPIQGPIWRGPAAPGMSIDPNTGMYDMPVPPVTSLSQPTTPSGAYQMHANMLSNELAVQGGGGGASATTGAGAPESDATSGQGPHENAQVAQYFAHQGAYANTTTPAGLFSSQPIATSVSDSNLYSTGVLLAAQNFQSEALPAVTITDEEGGVLGGVVDDDGNALLPAHQAESLNESTTTSGPGAQKWRRATNSDIMVARFFARVAAVGESSASGSSVSPSEGRTQPATPQSKHSDSPDQHAKSTRQTSASPNLAIIPADFATESASFYSHSSSSSSEGIEGGILGRLQRPPPLQLDNMSTFDGTGFRFPTDVAHRAPDDSSTSTPVSGPGSSAAQSPFQLSTTHISPLFSTNSAEGAGGGGIPLGTMGSFALPSPTILPPTTTSNDEDGSENRSSIIAELSTTLSTLQHDPLQQRVCDDETNTQPTGQSSSSS